METIKSKLELQAQQKEDMAAEISNNLEVLRKELANITATLQAAAASSNGGNGGSSSSNGRR